MHMPAPFLRQTEEHRCSSRVVVCGGSLLKKTDDAICKLGGGVRSACASHVPPLREYIPLAVSHLGVEFAPGRPPHCQAAVTGISVSPEEAGRFVNGQKLNNNLLLSRPPRRDVIKLNRPSY